jgi:hypothetical protein
VVECPFSAWIGSKPVRDDYDLSTACDFDAKWLKKVSDSVRDHRFPDKSDDISVPVNRGYRTSARSGLSKSGPGTVGVWQTSPELAEKSSKIVPWTHQFSLSVRRKGTLRASMPVVGIMR